MARLPGQELKVEPPRPARRRPPAETHGVSRIRHGWRPKLEVTHALLEGLARTRRRPVAHRIRNGLPYSDPIADGGDPGVLHAVLDSGLRLADIFHNICELRKNLFPRL